jgi:tetratricopeptide (TPR) repeat protein
LSQEVKWLQCESYATRGLADLEQKLGNMTRARRLYQEALRLSRQANDPKGLANAQYTLGDLELLQSNHKAALDLMRSSLATAKRGKYKQGIVNAWAGIGAVQLEIGDLNAAFKAYDTARELHTWMRDRMGQADTKLGLGKVKRLQNKPDEARKYFEDANLLYLAEQFILGQGNAQLDLGRLDSTLVGRAEAARDVFSKAIKLYETAGNALGLANAHFDLAQLNVKEHQYEAAAKNYLIALQHYKTKQNKLGQAKVLKKLEDLRKTEERSKQIGEKSDLANAANLLAEGFHTRAQAKLSSDPALAIKLWKKADQQYEISLQAKPDQYMALTDWGIVLTHLALESTRRSLLGAEVFWQRALDKYDLSLELNHDDPIFTATVFEKGFTLMNYGDATETSDADFSNTLRLRAIAQFKQVLDRFSDSFADKSRDQGAISQTQSRIEVERQYAHFGAANNWGFILVRQAKSRMKNDVDARRDFLRQAYDKFALAAKIEPPGYDAITNWASALITERDYLIRTEPEEAAKILRQARDMLLSQVDQASGGLLYNLACTYALDGMADEAVLWFKKAQRAGESIRQSDMLNESDVDSIRKNPQFVAWFKSLDKSLDKGSKK